MARKIHNVVIDGVAYVPISEQHMNVREAVARTLADMYWGELGEDWEHELSGHYHVAVVVTDETRECPDSPGIIEVADAVAKRIIQETP